MTEKIDTCFCECDLAVPHLTIDCRQHSKEYIEGEKKAFLEEVDEIAKKEKRYCVEYQFDGRGYVFIEAKSKAEAEEMFYNGEFEDENEAKSCNYEVVDITV